MSASGLFVFFAVYALAVATPGPAVAAVIARALARGAHGAPAFIAGFILGDLAWFACAALGLAVLAQRAYAVFLVVRYAGALYLLYVAWRLWRTPVRAPGADGTRREGRLQVFAGSLALSLGNPKTMIFFLAVLPTVVDLRHLTAGGFALVAAVILGVLPLVMGTYTLCAARARGSLAHPRATRWLQRGTGALMAGAALAVATR
ncbi:MAG: LysE family translocator [Gammaproteobacteria bacterium]|nr:LysE family translocator [Gammaproteobacteria bacterium]MBV9620762.1 LysE family translocator [Gammaproteobacteria bacterium]